MILLNNFPLFVAFIAMIMSQFLKVPFSYIKTKQVDWSLFVSTGGMPSSHSASVTALVTALILEYGFSSVYVSIAGTFALIVIFDSMGVRRHSGEQGILLNQLLLAFQTFLQKTPLEEDNKHTLKDVSIRQMLGHTPLEVLWGCLLGSGLTIALYLVFIK